MEIKINKGSLPGLDPGIYYEGMSDTGSRVFWAFVSDGTGVTWCQKYTDPAVLESIAVRNANDVYRNLNLSE